MKVVGARCPITALYMALFSFYTPVFFCCFTAGSIPNGSGKFYNVFVLALLLKEL